MKKNTVQIIGRITTDLELKTPKEGFSVLNFSLAVNEKYTNKAGEKVEVVDFINLQATNRLAELINKYAKKGHPLLVQGKIKTQSWEKDGVKQYKTFVDVQEVDFLKWYGEKKETTTESSTAFGEGDDVSISETPF